MAFVGVEGLDGLAGGEVALVSRTKILLGIGVTALLGRRTLTVDLTREGVVPLGVSHMGPLTDSLAELLLRECKCIEAEIESEIDIEEIERKGG